MRRIFKFFRLSLHEKFLFIESLLLLIIVKLGLSLLSFKKILDLLEKSRNNSKALYNKLSLEQIAWAVEVSGRYAPKATCLSKALTAQYLFRKNGYCSSVHIGVEKNSNGDLEAHAWIEIDGHIVIGNLKNISRYKHLTSITG